jgi:hypothetical protein
MSVNDRQKKLYTTARGVLIVILLLFILGCSSVDSVARKPARMGIGHEFIATPARVATAVEQSLPDLGLRLKKTLEKSDGSFVFLADTAISGWSWGEAVRVTVAPISDQATEVLVVTDRKLSPNVTAKSDYSGEIFTAVARRLRE